MDVHRHAHLAGVASNLALAVVQVSATRHKVGSWGSASRSRKILALLLALHVSNSCSEALGAIIANGHRGGITTQGAPHPPLDGACLPRDNTGPEWPCPALRARDDAQADSLRIHACLVAERSVLHA